MHFVNLTVQNQKHLFSKPTKQLNLLEPKNNNQSNNRIRSNRKRVISEHASGKNGLKLSRNHNLPLERYSASLAGNFAIFLLPLVCVDVTYCIIVLILVNGQCYFFFYLYVDAISVTIPKARTRKLSKRNILGRTMVIPWKENHPFIR